MKGGTMKGGTMNGGPRKGYCERGCKAVKEHPLPSVRQAGSTHPSGMVSC